ncbi:MAG: cytochrome c [Acidobacteriaceae bacterium]|nr:cytochrome c [Acidobacteriaceae bacterium]
MRPVQISTGETIIADDNYLRESIYDPNAKIVYGFHANIMPNFTGVIQPEQVAEIIAYIKALGPQPGAQEPSNPGTAPSTYGTQNGLAGPGATSISGSEVQER